MRRYSDIQELLEEVNDNITFLNDQKESAKSNEDIVKVSSPKLKSALEHLRSCLEYCSQDIAKSVLGIATNRIYFPYGRTEQDFNASLGRNLPGLSGSYLGLVKGLQPYECGDEWLIFLCSFTNINKHDSLQKQTRENKGKITTEIGGNAIRVEGGSNIQIGKLIVNGKLMNPSGPLELGEEVDIKDIKYILEDRIKVVRKHEFVSFIDSNTQVDLIELLEKSFKYISEFVEDLKTLIE